MTLVRFWIHFNPPSDARIDRQVLLKAFPLAYQLPVLDAYSAHHLFEKVDLISYGLQNPLKMIRQLFYVLLAGLAECGIPSLQ